MRLICHHFAGKSAEIGVNAHAVVTKEETNITSVTTKAKHLSPPKQNDCHQRSAFTAARASAISRSKNVPFTAAIDI
jgi:hypothetical protein